MRFIIRLLLVLITTFSLSTGALAAMDKEDWLDMMGGGSSVEAVMKIEQKAVQPGSNFTVAIAFDVQDPWHCYWQNPGDVGMGAQLQWILPPGYTVTEVTWPTPDRFETEGQIGFGYAKPFALLAEINVPDTVKAGDVSAITAEVQWVACSDQMCLPGSATLTQEITVAPTTQVASLHKDFFADARQALPKKISAARAVYQNGLLALQIDTDAQNATKIEFFSQDQQVVDHKQPLQILNQNKNVAIALPTYAQYEAKPLRGVIVVHGPEGKKGYSIDAPVDAKGSPELLAMLEAQNPPMKLPEMTSELDEFHFAGGFLLALAMAFLGGMILNLMPCVLPVISFKILSFVRMSGQDRSTILKHGLSFAAGVLISFWVLASLLMILQAYGRTVGWGFQLQEPLFVGILAAVMLVFGLSMFGVFEFGAFFAAWVGNRSAAPAEKQESMLASFSNGILATAVATPCTGPFLGSAVGYAVTLPPAESLLIFTFLGLGMAFPYLLLAAFPSMLRYLPKPGAWMDSFKEFMGFVMLGSVLWLVWVFGFQTDMVSQSMLLIGLFILSLACWIYGRWSAPHRSKRTRMLSMVLALILVGFGGQCILSAGKTSDETPAVASAVHAGGWENFDPDRIAALQAQGVPVFVDFTAKWCLICQTNHLVLSTQEVNQKMMEQGVVKMKADWTKSDPVITQYLKKFGRSGVPLYILYNGRPGDKPEILPQVLTQDSVLNSLERLPVPVAQVR
ncbi:MAG: thioredoxin family protein [Parachlamydiales bacterium]